MAPHSGVTTDQGVAHFGGHSSCALTAAINSLSDSGSDGSWMKKPDQLSAKSIFNQWCRCTLASSIKSYLRSQNSKWNWSGSRQAPKSGEPRASSTVYKRVSSRLDLFLTSITYKLPLAKRKICLKSTAFTQVPSMFSSIRKVKLPWISLGKITGPVSCCTSLVHRLINPNRTMYSHRVPPPWRTESTGMLYPTHPSLR